MDLDTFRQMWRVRGGPPPTPTTAQAVECLRRQFEAARKCLTETGHLHIVLWLDTQFHDVQLFMRERAEHYDLYVNGAERYEPYDPQKHPGLQPVAFAPKGTRVEEMVELS